MMSFLLFADHSGEIGPALANEEARKLQLQLWLQQVEAWVEAVVATADLQYHLGSHAACPFVCCVSGLCFGQWMSFF
jgi:hypothetical protein